MSRFKKKFVMPAEAGIHFGIHAGLGMDSRLGFGFLRRSIAYMAQASLSTGSRSHLLPVGVRGSDVF